MKGEESNCHLLVNGHHRRRKCSPTSTLSSGPENFWRVFGEGHHSDCFWVIVALFSFPSSFSLIYFSSFFFQIFLYLLEEVVLIFHLAFL
ncbi:hypothetical protein GLYMA_10G130900v4 [Glycine max]|uniref:Uncharacterized protein n=1 Tax=Glycine max TaxID=3847 RepID=K7LJ55_SOYBN|nr:hypothetical protein JHK87_027936 [Glycine soja]KAG4997251.1 hypothetical protein JHK85_028690 [Glycine max]KAG5004011.1 hypothetical protein JHK86_028150 [Glycine max]KAG5151804.1 hypothetical protein JHK84_028276 [Glycine max]KAH1138030.1 hypothetical protein GYH30_027862 [Glycine max]